MQLRFGLLRSRGSNPPYRRRFPLPSGFCLAGMVALLTYVRTQAQVPRALSLEQAQQEALAKNWDQLSADKDVAIANAQRQTAQEFQNPTFSVSSTHIDVRGHNETPLGNRLWDRSYDTVLSLSQPLEIGGKRSSRIASSEAEYKGGVAKRADLKRTFRLAVVQSYVAAALAERVENLTNDSATRLRKEAELAKVRLQSGDIAESDLAQIEIAARQLELAAGTARANAASMRVQLSFLLGAEKPDTALQITDSIETLADLPPPAPPSDAAHRADLIWAEQNERKADADLRFQRSLRVPDPTVVLQYEHQPPDAGNTVGIGLSFPLPLWNRNHGAIRAAVLAREQAALAVAKTRAQIVADVASARHAFQEASSRWTEYKSVIRPNAERVRESVSLAYEKGSASLLDLLQAQRSDNDVRLAAAQSAADTVLARAALEAAVTEQPNLSEK